ncbi:ROK family protein [Microlunatus elymi]|uniref:ROK family protein n=1 Tax=Microlunatus elymi TaxID=2596828 RepID=A0A516PW88_9ACTN|nr:ROK family protein [Microlunatus elymi]QDP95447.1 ROK family protein [Microlunatus elymi]
MATDPLCVGIDIGGSKIAAGVVDDTGRVTARGQVPTPASAGRRVVIGAAVRLVDELVGGRAVDGVGIGSAGVIGTDGRVAAATDLLTDWAGTQLVDGFQDQLPGRPQVVAVNDVHAHGVAEARYGAGVDHRCVLLLAVGTGLGGAVVEDGRPARGAHGAAGHVGHVDSVDAGDLPCSCGRTGHLEAIASGYGLLQLYRELGGAPQVTGAREIIARVDVDPVAVEAARRSARALGRGIGNLINVTDPGIVVISGGVGQAGEFWWDEVRAAARGAAMPLLADTVLVPASLGADAGLIGAARLAHDRLRTRS